MTVSKALINGAGPAGLSAAIALARIGISVHVSEVTPDRTVLGSELLLSSANLRALASLNVAESVVARGVPISSIRLRAPDDTVLVTLPVPQVTPEFPPSVGISRRALHDVLYDAAVAAGASVHHGVSIECLHQSEDAVDVILSDGSTATYDLVVGADGVESRVRRLAFPDAPSPEYVGQCVWRARVPRQGDPCLDAWYGAGSNVGIITVDDETSYLFCLVDLAEPPRLERTEFPALLREQLRRYDHGLVAWTREHLGGADDIHFSPMMWLVQPLPWHVGAVVLVGDAVHATTPHIGYGAGLAIEDGVVLGEELEKGDELAQTLTRVGERRFERCRMVVEGGVQISRWQQSPEPHEEDQGQLTDVIWRTLAHPV